MIKNWFSDLYATDSGMGGLAELSPSTEAEIVHKLYNCALNRSVCYMHAYAMVLVV